MQVKTRLSLALAAENVSLPAEGYIAVFNPRADQDLSFLPQDRLRLITGFKPDMDRLVAMGYDCVTEQTEACSGAIVFLPRAKALAQSLIHQAARLAKGPVIIDGDKQDGIESILKACRARTKVSAPFSKAHGKVFSVPSGDWCSEWHAIAGPNADGFVTAPGVFSADSIDPASRLLVDHLPTTLSGVGADMGCGWGYLSSTLLAATSKVEKLHLVEADKAALDCAKENVTDERAEFHWQDACTWGPDHPVDFVIMNPPFHTSRDADPELGRRFVRAAAKILKPRGELWMVANRHLPYETELNDCFKEVVECVGDNRFKIFHATRPSRSRR